VGLRRLWIPGAPLLAWALLLLTKPALWEPVPRVTSGFAPPFAAIGTIAEVFGAVLLGVAVFHSRRQVAWAAGLGGVAVSLVFLAIALRM
jgi:hypothetical protein